MSNPPLTRVGILARLANSVGCSIKNPPLARMGMRKILRRTRSQHDSFGCSIKNPPLARVGMRKILRRTRKVVNY